MKNMENICQCDRGYKSCKGEVQKRDLKKDFQWDVKAKNYNLTLCDYHFQVIHYMKNNIIDLLKSNG